MTSLWLDDAEFQAQIYGGATTEVPNAEVVVVDAGITGLVTAVLLARGGKHVVAVEARTPGAVTTGNTTAKVSLLQGSRLSTISRRHSPELVRQYVEGNREGQAWLAACWTRWCTMSPVGW
jgi:glycine/D-amino acid oxidase-like deaminating enzyme